jgi:malate synthase
LAKARIADGKNSHERHQLFQGVVICGAMKPGYQKPLTPGTIDFAVELEREFGAERRRLLAHRAEIQRRLDAGWKPDSLPETRAIREADWRVASIPRGLHEPPRRDHRSDRPQDGDQCAQLRRQRLYGRFRGLPTPRPGTT